MGRRGVSAGGGQSSLGYLFGSGSGDAETSSTSAFISAQQSKKLQASAPKTVSSSSSDYHHQKPTSTADQKLQIPAGIPGNRTNNYHRADGQNCGNFITNRPSTKVNAAPGGGSSLGYFFGGSGN